MRLGILLLAISFSTLEKKKIMQVLGGSKLIIFDFNLCMGNYYDNDNNVGYTIHCFSNKL